MAGFRRTSAGTEILPWAVSFEEAIRTPTYYQGNAPGRKGGGLLILEDLDSHRTWGRRERPIAGDKRSVQRLGQGKVSGIIGRHVVAQLPDAGKQNAVRVAVGRKGGEIVESFRSPPRRDRAGASVAA